jgi:hypothetical protein
MPLRFFPLVLSKKVPIRHCLLFMNSSKLSWKTLRTDTVSIFSSISMLSNSTWKSSTPSFSDSDSTSVFFDFFDFFLLAFLAFPTVSASSSSSSFTASTSRNEARGYSTLIKLSRRSDVSYTSFIISFLKN